MRYGDKNENPAVKGRYGSCTMAQAKCKGGHTRTPNHTFQAAVAVSLGLCGIPFRAASKGNKQAKGMLKTNLGPIGRARDAAKAPGKEVREEKAD